jgi:hypothetical protein
MVQAFIFNKIKKLVMQRRFGLLLAAAAAYGAYRYSKLSTEQKNDMKAKGKDFLDKNFGNLTNVFSKKKTTANEPGF